MMLMHSSTFVSAETINTSPYAAYLGDFIVSKQPNGTVAVKWTTISEHNNKYFSIEHSTDGVHYTVIGQMLSKGNTSNGFSYEFIDNKPGVGKNFYRIGMVDISERKKYSDIRIAHIAATGKNMLFLFPNPAVNSITLQLNVKDNDELKVEIYDVTGNKVYWKTCTMQNQKTELDIECLKTGIYMIVVVTPIGMQYTSTLIVMK